MIRLENVLKTSLQDVLKMSWRRLEDFLETSWRRLENVLKTPWRRLEDVLKTSWRCLEEVWPRQIYWFWSRRLEDVFWRRRRKSLQKVFIKTNVCWDVTSNKNELNELSEKVKVISTKGLTKYLINKFSILNGAKYFSSGIFPNCLVFISAKKYIIYFNSTTQIDSQKSNGMSEETIENITKSDSNFAPTFVDHHVVRDINLNGRCKVNNNYIPKKVINIHIFYPLNAWSRNLNTGFTLIDCLFGSVKLTKKCWSR